MRPVAVDTIPPEVWTLPLGERIKWARERCDLSHDRLAKIMRRSNRGHLIKIEKGRVEAPRQDLRDAIADACGVPRELFADAPQEAAPVGGPFRDGRRDGARADQKDPAEGARGSGSEAA